MRTGAGLTCGTCSSLAGEILDQAKRELAFPLPLLVAA
jgi:bacterioferritin-associated ferredoxin